MNTKVLKTDNYVSPDYFHTKAKTYLINNTNQKKSTSIATLDIDHFNYINDMFGFENGDRMLQILIDHISKHIKKGDFFTRIHADVFAFCLQTKDHDEISAYFNTLTTWPKALKDLFPQHYSVTASGGIVVIDDYSMPISAYLDKANYARQNSKGTQTNSFRYFDEKMSASLQWEKVVTFSMESALENREFEMYLQPKFLIKTNEVVGAEALCRWNHPEHGLIAPDRFIPILEQNGFIRQLDFYMLEEACHFLNRNKKQGLPLIPISVNFSKTHLSSDDLVDRIFKTVNRLGINTKLIEIEFTESITIEGFERLVEVVTDLKILGFSVSLDDFGSAYSSLNCLQELPIDIIKIDKGFLNSSTNNEKGKLIISKVVELIKSLRMLSVMEGVETNEQVDFLHKLSCDLGQGYFYAKPMPADQFLNFLRNDTSISNIETYIADQNNEDKSYLHVIPYEFQMDNWELYTLGKNIDMGLMKGYLDGEATVQYVNDRALEYLGYTRQEFREVFHNSIAAFTHPDDVAIVQKNAEQLIKTGKPLQFKTRAFHKSGRIIILQGRSSCVIDDRGRPIGLYAFQDVTEEIEKTQQLQSSLKDKIKELELVIKRESNAREELHLINERYQAIVEQSNDIMFDWDFVSDTLVLSNHLKHRFLMNEKNRKHVNFNYITQKNSSR